MENIKEFWKNLNPKAQLVLKIIGGLFIIGMAVNLASCGTAGGYMP